MMRSIESIFIVFVFSLPCAMAASMLWPFIRHRPISHQIEGDLFLLVTISLLGGILITLLSGGPTGTKGERKMR